jgi:dynactin 1
MPHLSDVRGSKTAFQFDTVLSFVAQTATATVNKDKKDVITPWQGVTNYMAHVLQKANALLPLAMEPENIMKSRFLFLIHAIRRITSLQ